MPLTLHNGAAEDWTVRRIGVIGPGIVGMPMAALLAAARVRIGQQEPAHVVVIQRNSPTSGWKVAAINDGRSPIGGLEPRLDQIVRDAVADGHLSASHDPAALADADVILVCVQTDKTGLGPDYGPLMEALEGLSEALAARPVDNLPLVIFESTLAPSSMSTVIRDFFSAQGLEEGRDVLLGNSPNRVMPGRLVERVAQSDKIVAGLSPVTPELIARLYRHIVTSGRLHQTNSMTAEIVKTLENAYRDVRIAYSAEVARYCDTEDIDFYDLRDRVNEALAQTDASSNDPQSIPSGGLLVPMVGVGGHCLPKDGILLWWRAIEAGLSTANSLILASRDINDASPAATLALAEKAHGSLAGSRVALLGVAYRFDSEDTRNSPTLALVPLLQQHGATVIMHDPYVAPTDQNLKRSGTTGIFTQDLDQAMADADLVVLCTGHKVYGDGLDEIMAGRDRLRTVVDACNLTSRQAVEAAGLTYTGIGRGVRAPTDELLGQVLAGFRAVEHGVANELEELIAFLNDRYASDDFSQVHLDEVRSLTATCVTECVIGEPATVVAFSGEGGFSSRLVARATVERPGA